MKDSVTDAEEFDEEFDLEGADMSVEDTVSGDLSKVDATGRMAQGGGASAPDDDLDSATDEEGAAELDTLRREFEHLNDRHLRLAAEFNNFRRRSEQERLESWSRAQADLVGKFLDVLDDLSRVAELDLTNATVEAIMEGVDLVERKFVRMLADAGVEMIDPGGQKFDPERMEAMMRVPIEGDEEDESVAQVFQKGYSLKGVLVRPARVSVYKQG
jgi:molecular chaperone GrpE